jgi:hypothetical protein
VSIQTDDNQSYSGVTSPLLMAKAMVEVALRQLAWPLLSFRLALKLATHLETKLMAIRILCAIVRIVCGSNVDMH